MRSRLLAELRKGIRIGDEMVTKQLDREEQDLHPNQKKLLELLEEHKHEPLTIRELQNRLSVASTSVVQHHLKQLIKKGYLKKDLNNNKYYQIQSESPESRVSYLNLYESNPNNPTEQIPIPTQFLGFPASQAFLLRITDNSMSPKLFKGDIAIVQRDIDNPENGDIVFCTNSADVFIGEFQAISNEHSFIFSLSPRFAFKITSSSKIIGVIRGKISYQIQ